MKVDISKELLTDSFFIDSDNALNVRFKVLRCFVILGIILMASNLVINNVNAIHGFIGPDILSFFSYYNAIPFIPIVCFLFASVAMIFTAKQRLQYQDLSPYKSEEILKFMELEDIYIYIQKVNVQGRDLKECEYDVLKSHYEEKIQSEQCKKLYLSEALGNGEKS